MENMLCYVILGALAEGLAVGILLACLSFAVMWLFVLMDESTQGRKYTGGERRPSGRIVLPKPWVWSSGSRRHRGDACQPATSVRGSGKAAGK